MKKLDPDTMDKALKLAEALEDQGCLITVQGLRVLYESLDRPEHTPGARGYCEDCTDEYRTKMERQGRCYIVRYNHPAPVSAPANTADTVRQLRKQGMAWTRIAAELTIDPAQLKRQLVRAGLAFELDIEYSGPLDLDKAKILYLDGEPIAAIMVKLDATHAQVRKALEYLRDTKEI